jgi:Ca-activated chloride channel family protein
MNGPDKLPLLKNALRLLVERLRPEDRVGIVVYAGATGVVLESTPGDRKAEIIAALDRLSAGGPTHGAAGLELAYRLVEQHRVADGINRVILATDGDFNVGVVDHDRLVDLIERRRETGISLTTLGFGSGNYNDHLMEQLADRGNGNYAYIDTLNEARKVLVEEMTSTLETIASDVKIQVEWNPAHVAEYRLIGYENRGLRREDFNNDAVDAGEIGAGHSVTALYEITLAGQPERRIEPLRYGGRQVADAPHGDELGYLRLRYRLPGADRSRLIEQALPVPAADARWQDASADFRFSAAVAAFAERLRGGAHAAGADYPLILDLARQARGDDASGYRGEFLQLVKLAQAMSRSQAPGQPPAAGPAGSGEVAER